MVNPCCGILPLQIGTKIVSIIDAIGAMFGAFTSFVVLLGIIFFKKELEEELYRSNAEDKNYELKRFMEQPALIQYSMLLFTLIVAIVEIVFAVILFKGARTRNAAKCSLWFRVHIVLLGLAILFSIGCILVAEEQVIISISCVIGLLYQLYALWIVRAFVQEINSLKFSTTEEDEQGEPLQDMQKS